MFRSASSASYLAGSTIDDPNGYPVRFLALLASIVAFIAAVAQVLGRTLRDPWEHSSGCRATS